MSESAIGLRERRRLESAERVIELAREWTARDGFTGYTVEELCEAAGVSRRTFFNYFASKEDAVLGILAPHGDDELTQRFLDGGGGAASSVSATLVDDFVALHLARWEIVAPSASDVRAMKAAVEREPRLHTRIFEMIQANEQRDIALIEQREKWEAGDLRALTLVHIVGAFSRATAQQYFSDHGDAPPSIAHFSRLFEQQLAAARDLLT